MALMFPVVMLVLNVSSVAVLWFGAHRIDAGRDADRRADRVPQLPDADPDVGDDGDLHVHDGAARRGVRRAHRGGARHRAAASPPRPSRSPSRRSTGDAGAARRRLPLPGRRGAGAARTSTFAARPGQTTAIIGSHRQPARPRCSTWSRGCSTSPAARCSSTASTYASSTRSCCRGRSDWSRRSRTCSPARSRRNLRYGNPDATDEELWARARGRAGPRLRRGDARAASTPRSRRAAPTSPAGSASGWRSPGRWSAGRRSTSSTTPSRRSTTPPTPALRAALAEETADATVVIVAQRVSTIRDADRIVVLDDGRVVGTGTHAELLAAQRPTGRSCESAAHRGGGGMSTPGAAQPAGERQLVEGARSAASDETERPADARPVAGPVRGRRWPAEASMNFGPSARRLVGRMRPEPATGDRGAALAAASVVLASIGPKHPRPRHRPDLLRRHRSAGSPRGSTKAAGGRTAARARPGPASPTCCRASTSCPARASTSARSGACCCWCWRCTCGASLLAWLQGFLLNDVVKHTVRRLRERGRGQAQPAAADLLRPAAARRAAEPGHQRHRQRQPDPAADHEPACSTRC